MKLFIFTLLCLSVVVLSFLDFLAAKPTTVFSYLVMYGDFFKSFLNIEKKYFIQTLLMTLFIVTSSWCLIPALLKQLHVSKKLVRNILMTFSGIFFIYLSFFRIGIQDLFIIFFQKTSFYEDNYIFYSLKNDNLPERKKNLILIFAESLEQSYANPTSRAVFFRVSANRRHRQHDISIDRRPLRHSRHARLAGIFQKSYQIHLPFRPLFNRRFKQSRIRHLFLFQRNRTLFK